MKIDKKILEELDYIRENRDELYKKQSEERGRFLNDPANKELREQVKLRISLAKMLYKARKSAHLTQSELAEKLHTSQSNLARMERGQNISVDTLEKYAYACGKKVKISIT
jgi:ribosome-binding protein aMBF1 (putative translation factor)